MGFELAPLPVVEINGVTGEANAKPWGDGLAPVTLYRIAYVSDYFSYRIGVSFTLLRSDPLQHVGAKSLRSGGDTKSNPICAVP